MSAARIIDLSETVGQLDGERRQDVVAIVEGYTSQKVIELISKHGIRHVVQKDGCDFTAEVETAKIMIVSPERFLSDPASVIFGVTGARSLSRFAFETDATEKKTHALANFGSFVQSLKGSRAIVDPSMLIADEFYTNASKCAWPQDAKIFFGQPTRAGRIELFALADQSRLLIGCRDTFGLLTTGTLIERLNVCATRGLAAAIRRDQAGAGIGTFLAFDHCASYYAGVIPGQISIVCASLPLGMNRRDIAAVRRNIHLIGDGNSE